MCYYYHEAVADPSWVVSNSNKVWYILIGVHGCSQQIATKSDMCTVQQQIKCVKSPGDTAAQLCVVVHH